MDVETIRMICEVVGGVALAVLGKEFTVARSLIVAVCKGVESFAKQEPELAEKIKRSIYIESKKEEVDKTLDVVVSQLGFKNGSKP